MFLKMKKKREKFSFSFEIRSRKWFLLSSPFWIMLEVLIFMAYYKKPLNIPNYYFILNQSKKSFPGVYFTVIVNAPLNNTRLLTSYRKWGNKLKYYSKESIYKVFSLKRMFPFGNQTNLYKLEDKRHKSFGMTVPYFDAMDDFLKNTDLQWFFRTTDDVWVNLDAFSDYMEYLNSVYDPTSDIAIKGEVIYPERAGWFMHGGAGWIMSRKACIETMKQGRDFPFSDRTAGDDYVLPEMRYDFDMPPYLFSSSAFLSTPLDDISNNALLTNNFSLIEKCPEKNCRILTRIKDIAVWHAGDRDLNVIVHGDEFIQNAPENLYARMAPFRSRICFGDYSHKIPIWKNDATFPII